MPVICEAVEESPAAPLAALPRTALRVVLITLAVVIVAAGVALLAAQITPPVPAKNPFGIGPVEAAPSGSGIGRIILEWQSAFYRLLTDALKAVRSGGGVLALVGLSFAYGVFHAAGPGHGKGVVAAQAVAERSGTRPALMLGAGLSLGAALVQALVALLVVGIATVALRATAVQVTAIAGHIETAGFTLVAAMGGWLLWRKSAPAADLFSGRITDACANGCGDHCGHLAFVPSERALWRERAGIVLAAGMRPCSGALIVLVFALSQGLVAAGVLSVLAMALGTAITTSALAALTIGAKTLATRMAGQGSRRAALAATTVELLAAAFVLVLGVSLLFGLWTGQGAGAQAMAPRVRVVAALA